MNTYQVRQIWPGFRQPIREGAIGLFKRCNSFYDSRAQTLEVGDSPTSVDLVDLDGDERLDIVVGSKDGFELIHRLAGAIGGAMAQLDKTFPTNDCSM